LRDMPHGHDLVDVNYWRASDVLKARQRMLKAGFAQSKAKHIFGDILMRVPTKLRNRLRLTLELAEDDFKQFVGTAQSKTELKSACEALGRTMMMQLMDVMSTHTFVMDKLSWCFKCKKLCRVHGPRPQAQELQRNQVRVACAGTTCTSWSTMGSKKRWLAASALPFMIWAYETRAWEPHCIFHECTARFLDSVRCTQRAVETYRC